MSNHLSNYVMVGVGTSAVLSLLFNRIRSTNTPTPAPSSDSSSSTPTKTTTIRVAYGTQTGTSLKLAHLFANSSNSSNTPSKLPATATTSVVDMKTYDVDNLEKENVIVFIMCTWEGGVPPESAKIFCDWLEDMAHDFRVPNTFLANTSYAVFGLGSSEYAPVDRFCTAALRLDENMHRLGAKRIVDVGLGDASQVRFVFSLFLVVLCYFVIVL